MLAPWPTCRSAATHISEAVVARLGHDAWAPARIEAVYESVVNVATSGGLVSISRPHLGGLPNGIRADLGADARALGLDAGMAVLADASTLRVPAAGLVIDLRAAQRWSPRLPAAGAGAAEAWRRRSPGAWLHAGRRASSRGFGALLLGRPSAGADLALAVRARPIVAGLSAAIADADRRAAAAAARNLIGLGPGLTPSGDDVVVGAEAGLWALGSPAAGFSAAAIDDVDERTTSVAAAFLRHAAAGGFAERLHALLAALLGGEDGAVGPAIDRAVAWGASSGTDSLLGVLIGLDAGLRGFEAAR